MNSLIYMKFPHKVTKSTVLVKVIIIYFNSFWWKLTVNPAIIKSKATSYCDNENQALGNTLNYSDNKAKCIIKYSIIFIHRLWIYKWLFTNLNNKQSSSISHLTNYQRIFNVLQSQSIILHYKNQCITNSKCILNCVIWKFFNEKGLNVFWRFSFSQL